MKYLLLFIAVIVGLQLLKQSRPRPGATQPRAKAAPEAMLECSRCGVHVPASRAVHSGGRAYCCDAHARLG